MKSPIPSLTIVLLILSTYVYGQRVEAETGILTGTHVGNSRSGYSGNGYVTGFDQEGDMLAIEVNMNQAGLYTLSVGYAADSYKENYIIINGENVGSMQFETSATFKTKAFGKVQLNQGVNTIAIQHFWGWTDVDYISLESTAPADFDNISPTLVTTNAADITKRLYAYLGDIYGSKILSGQQGSDLSNIQHIQQVTGKLPAVRGFDFIDYSPSRVEHGASSNETQDIIDWHNQGGIVTACWHWNAPKDLIDQVDKEWWRGFYTYATTFDVSIAMNNSNSQEYQLLIRDIDVIAQELKTLQQANIPVLFRPLHEAEGEWFWWGAKGPEPCKWLWRVMFDRMINYHGINNLIWVWTTTDSENAMNWYPGDEYVDIVGADIYLSPGNYSTSFSMFDNIVAQFNGEKIVTLSETGTIPTPTDLENEGAYWNWFCTWEGGFIKDGNYNTQSHLVEVFNHDYVITLDELPNIATYVNQPNVEEQITAIDGIPSFKIYPNPVHANLTVELLSSTNRIQLISMQGQVLQDIFDPQASQTIDMTSLESGIYIIRMIQDNQIVNRKILKE
ncbi:glycosyl hydrolase [Fulvivirga ligni]|uniref:glycosyl hydrolase n=1 Tax=Fulvivirga ligni TaxID=2904246 RepID=UPI001F162A5D|nr:glycosyl hydrolase [Fulvivirga ligni]UII23662.1 T9SS type A sorting domain-containing protein [Fulvivirga ligni]